MYKKMLDWMLNHLCHNSLSKSLATCLVFLNLSSWCCIAKDFRVDILSFSYIGPLLSIFFAIVNIEAEMKKKMQNIYTGITIKEHSLNCKESIYCYISLKLHNLKLHLQKHRIIQNHSQITEAYLIIKLSNKALDHRVQYWLNISESHQ